MKSELRKMTVSTERENMIMQVVGDSIIAVLLSLMVIVGAIFMEVL
jgi:hypothetical protein